MLNWFSEKGLKQGVFWAVMIYVTSALNDVCARILGSRLHFVEISFFRFLFSALIAFAFMIFSRQNLFKTSIPKLHAYRGILGAVALGLCCYSVNVMPLAENTTILFAESLFMLPLAHFFLKENISRKSIWATAVGFLGLILMFKPRAENLNFLALIPTVAATLFATMNIIIKKMIACQEKNWTMLFFFGIYTTAIAGLFVPFVWQTPNLQELGWIFLLGAGANLIQLFIFLAYRATTASSISPVRYIELPIVMLLGFLCFGEIPHINAILGGIFIIFGTILATKA